MMPRTGAADAASAAATGAAAAPGRSGRFARLLLPAVILQSVLIGGGYATGREVVEYGGRFGAAGWAAVATIFVGFSLLAFLTFEVARLYRAYSYKRFIQRLIGPAWPAFDLLFLVMAILIIAVMASAAANIMDSTLGVPPWAGTALIIVAVGLLTFFGSRVIEVFKTFGTTILYAAYLAFSALVLTRRGDGMLETLAAGDVSYGGGTATAGAAVLAGVLYVGYNLAVFPAVLFALHRQRSRRDTAVAGLLSGLLMTIPFALTYLCLLAFYPDPGVLDAPVPWLPMLEAVGGPWVIVAFGVVMGWTLLETSVGLIHALIERVDADLRAVAGEPAAAARTGGVADATGGPAGGEAGAGLSRWQAGLLGAGVLLGATALSRVGIVALVAQGYTIMGYLFIALFALPLLTVGVVRIVRAGRA